MYQANTSTRTSIWRKPGNSRHLVAPNNVHDEVLLHASSATHPRPFEQHRRPPMRTKSYQAITSANRLTSFVPFNLPPLLASSPPSAPGHRSLARKIREPLQEANPQCGAGVELGVRFI